MNIILNSHNCALTIFQNLLFLEICHLERINVSNLHCFETFWHLQLPLMHLSDECSQHMILISHRVCVSVCWHVTKALPSSFGCHSQRKLYPITLICFLCHSLTVAWWAFLTDMISLWQPLRPLLSTCGMDVMSIRCLFWKARAVFWTIRLVCFFGHGQCSRDKGQHEANTHHMGECLRDSYSYFLCVFENRLQIKLLYLSFPFS